MTKVRASAHRRTTGGFVRRTLFQSVVAIGVLIAFAILGTGPRANAAFIPTGGRSVSIDPVNLEDSSEGWDIDDESTDEFAKAANIDARRLPANFQRGNPSSTGSPPTSSGGADSPNAGLVAVPELPPPAQVQYLRSFAARLELSRYIDFILDPPRMI
jgi:hypothetical protein